MVEVTCDFDFKGEVRNHKQVARDLISDLVGMFHKLNAHNNEHPD